MASFGSYPFYPGQAATGVDVRYSALAVTGYLQKQGGVRSWQPNITQPGTTASGGTVFNTTGLDCMVYLTPTMGTLGAVKVLSSQFASATSYAIPGGAAINTTMQVMVPGPGGIAAGYNGTLSWQWVPV